MSSNNTVPTNIDTQVVQIKLIPAQTAEEKQRNIIANIVIEGHSLPYIDDTASAIINAEQMTQLYAEATPKKAAPRLRYYAVGPSTYKIRCPLCKQHGDAAIMRGVGIKDLGCCLSLLSCFFPLFWICCLCTWCGCNREWTTKGLYCSKCGGKLGVQRKVK